MCRKLEGSALTCRFQLCWLFPFQRCRMKTVCLYITPDTLMFLHLKPMGLSSHPASFLLLSGPVGLTCRALGTLLLWIQTVINSIFLADCCTALSYMTSSIISLLCLSGFNAFSPIILLTFRAATTVQSEQIKGQ